MNMHAPSRHSGVTLPFDVLDILMPMHVAVDDTGCIRHCGPTIAKLLGDEDAENRPLLDMFDVRHPAGLSRFSALREQAGVRLSLVPKPAPHLPLRAVIMPLPSGDGMILDISLGLSFERAVTDKSLTLHDFSPCDQTVELLYLHEAKTLTSRLSRHLSERLQAAQVKAEHQARTDVLTGINNRRAMDDELEHLLVERCHDFTLLHMDLDRFKDVNDTFGHAAGDAVLLEVGNILVEELRGTDFPARVGGDEFLIVLRPAPSVHIAGRIASRLIKRIEEPIQFEENVCQISASIGIVSTFQYARRPLPAQILADVDTTLYRAKHNGRGQFAIFEGTSS